MPRLFSADEQRGEVTDYKVILVNVAYATYARFLKLFVSSRTSEAYPTVLRPSLLIPGYLAHVGNPRADSFAGQCQHPVWRLVLDPERSPDEAHRSANERHLLSEPLRPADVRRWPASTAHQDGAPGTA